MGWTYHPHVTRPFDLIIDRYYPFVFNSYQDASEYYQYFLNSLIKAEKSSLSRIDPTGTAVPLLGTRSTAALFEFHIEERLQCAIPGQVKSYTKNNNNNNNSNNNNNNNNNNNLPPTHLTQATNTLYPHARLLIISNHCIILSTHSSLLYTPPGEIHQNQQQHAVQSDGTTNPSGSSDQP